MHLALLLLLASSGVALRQTIERGGDVVRLPPGTFTVSRPIRVPDGVRVLGSKSGTVLRASRTFRGAALLIAGSNVTIENLTIDGNRDMLARRVGIAPDDKDFVGFYDLNGIVADGVHELTLRRVTLRRVANFPVLVARSRAIRIESLRIADSGSLNQLGRNNTTGGILLEEGTVDFTVRDCEFTRVRGNGIWTHSRYTSPRNGPGLISGNRFDTVARDAIQVGHATKVRVEGNTGTRVGFPASEVDSETGGTPVGIDTAGNVDQSAYVGNRFTETNGKCIDLDGFHHGDVRDNVCINRGRAADYPHGHYGIVVNAFNPDMTSEEITIAGNVVDGAKFGGIFLIGRRHTVTGNRLLNLNLAGCNESAAVFGCVAIQGEPDVLQSGIYLGRIAAEWAQKRASPSRGHIIRDNVITGHKMRSRCIAAAPGVALAASTIENNTCEDTRPNE